MCRLYITNTTVSVDKSTHLKIYVCNVLKHRGKILENAINNSRSKVNIAELARKTGYDRTTVYQHLKKEDLDYGILIKYGKALNHDFSKEFPELIEYISKFEEPLSEYKPLTLSDALKQVDYWKDKYIQLLEKHNEMIMSQLNKK